MDIVEYIYIYIYTDTLYTHYRGKLRNIVNPSQANRCEIGLSQVVFEGDKSLALIQGILSE